MSIPWNQPGATTGPQPGWYQDPSGNPQLRWWDGSQWTSRVTTQLGYPVTPPEREPPVQATPPSQHDGGWRPRVDDLDVADIEPGAARPMGTDARGSWTDFMKQHKVITAVAVLAIFAVGVSIAAGDWGGVLLLIALGAFAGWARGKKMRKTTYALTGLLVLAAIGGTASDFSSSSSPQAQHYSGAEVECGYSFHDGDGVEGYIILGSMNAFACNAGLSAIQSNWSDAVGPMLAITNSDPIPNEELNAPALCSGYMGDYFVTMSPAMDCAALGLSD